MPAFERAGGEGGHTGTAQEEAAWRSFLVQVQGSEEAGPAALGADEDEDEDDEDRDYSYEADQRQLQGDGAEEWLDEAGG